jgi:hypothetical protein
LKENKMYGMMNQTEGVSSMSETVDGITKSVNVEEIENGFIVTIHKYGMKSSGEGCSECEGEYIDETKRFYSKENPLNKEAKQEEEEREMSREDVFALIDML